MTTLPVCSGDLTISSHEEATRIAICTTYSGTIEITEPAATIALDGITDIVGSLIVNETFGFDTLSSSSLQNISDFLSITNTSIQAIKFPKLQDIGTLELAQTPSLQELELGDDAFVSTLTIRGPFWSSEQLQLNISYVSSARLTALHLKKFSMGLEHLDTLTISNQTDGEVIEFPRLASAHIIAIGWGWNVSLPALESIYSYTYDENYGTKLDLPSLADVAMDFTVIKSSISEVNLPSLFNVTRLELSDNYNLRTLDLELLSAVSTDVVLRGVFNSVSMPSLKELGGDFTLMTTSQSLNCSTFDTYRESKMFKNFYYCSAMGELPSSLPSSSASPSTSTSTSRSTPPSASPGSSLSAGAKAGIGVAVSLLVLALLGGSITIWLRRRNRKSAVVDRPGHGKPETNGFEKPEIDGIEILPGELATGKEAHELMAEYVYSEVEGVRVRAVESVHEMGSNSTLCKH
ncbi:hypothetical protein P154DRAFT_566277 [Amniculicola lignicola CBS 123094]|uniref:Uncharacterized protein n=1 Tax=Amniculicola lignicola CBS 123094 TaxID=1392246 RepID=A0A6A5W5K2_9PLEO|nr:hypothetical protein P154DRAFT_566277 [Amniculicola lignicola CBS 123094]